MKAAPNQEITDLISAGEEDGRRCETSITIERQGLTNLLTAASSERWPLMCSILVSGE